MNNKRFTSEEDLEELATISKLIEDKAVSYRVGAQLLKARTGKSISHEGLRKIIKNDINNRDTEALVGDEPRGIPEE